MKLTLAFTLAVSVIFVSSSVFADRSKNLHAKKKTVIEATKTEIKIEEEKAQLKINDESAKSENIVMKKRLGSHGRTQMTKKRVLKDF